jgi:hypothetical protein
LQLGSSACLGQSAQSTEHWLDFLLQQSHESTIQMMELFCDCLLPEPLHQLQLDFWSQLLQREQEAGGTRQHELKLADSLGTPAGGKALALCNRWPETLKKLQGSSTLCCLIPLLQQGALLQPQEESLAAGQVAAEGPGEHNLQAGKPCC